MIIKEPRFIIATRKSPIKYEADARLEFYSEGELTEFIDDAYKYFKKEEADKQMAKKQYDPEEYEVRQLNITYEIQ
jgi:hypothetical protein